MQLEKHLVPSAGDGPAEGGVDIGSAGAQVEEVDAVVEGLAHHGFDFRGRAVLNAVHADAQHAEFFLGQAVGKLTIFHDNPPCCDKDRYVMI